MSEPKSGGGGGGGAFAKVLTKQLSRTKAKVMQNLGKTVKTSDQTFDQYVANFRKQQETAHRLQKELKHYLHCVTEMTLASKRIFEMAKSVCEPEWQDYSGIEDSVQSLDVLHASYHNELTTRVSPGLNAYIARFPEVKEKIDKRRRKLLDFDNARHNLETAQNARKKDENKIAKAQESYNLARHTFEELNTELHTELPDLYDSRVQFYATNLQQFFGAEHTLHTETGKMHERLVSIMAALEDSSGKYAVERGPVVRASVLSETPTKGNHNSSMDAYDQNAKDLSVMSTISETENSRSPKPAERSPPITEENARNGDAEDFATEAASAWAGAEGDNLYEDADEHRIRDGEKEEDRPPVKESSPPVPAVTADEEEAGTPDEEGGAYENTDLTQLPVGVKYRVVATHKYSGEDDDELEFESGEIINVVDFDDPDDQDEGWEMGVKVSDGKKGLFPCNFTKRLQ